MKVNQPYGDFATFALELEASASSLVRARETIAAAQTILASFRPAHPSQNEIDALLKPGREALSQIEEIQLQQGHEGMFSEHNAKIRPLVEAVINSNNALLARLTYGEK